MKVQKFWILYDYTELTENMEQEYPEEYLGITGLGMCPYKIGAVEGNYIIMPINGDLDYYRNELIKSMIRDEKTKIIRASRKLGDLLDMM